MKRLLLSCCASVAAVGWLAGPTVAAAAAIPPTLSGEEFSATGGPTSVTCTLSGIGSFSFTASGMASGPYAGTFQETGSGTVDRSTQTLTAFSASFIINADGGVAVTGTIALAPGTPVPCQQADTTTVLTATAAPTTYHATIHTSEGDYRDHGTAAVQSLWTSSSGGTSLEESFTSTLTQPKSSASPDTLIGNPSVESGSDHVDGLAEAFPFTASASGQATEASVFVDSDSTATGLVIGLYSDSGGTPGTLLGQGSTSNPISGAWNTLSFPWVPISAGTRYWLAVLGTGGQLTFRDESTDGSCRSVTSDSTSVMPTSFSASWWDTCNVSAYLSGLEPASPSSTSAPTISGDFSYHGSGESGWGGTVSATIGAWKSSDPPTYSFQWQQCDSSGGNCSNVPSTGTVPDQYRITPGEVDNTIRVAVTATNHHGSTTAYSEPSPVITAAS